MAIKHRKLIELLIQLQTLFGLHPGGSDGKESACSAGDLGSIPGLEDPLEKGVFLEKRYPLRYPCLENPMDSGAHWGTIHGVVQRVGHD